MEEQENIGNTYDGQLILAYCQLNGISFESLTFEGIQLLRAIMMAEGIELSPTPFPNQYVHIDSPNQNVQFDSQNLPRLSEPSPNQTVYTASQNLLPNQNTHTASQSLLPNQNPHTASQNSNQNKHTASRNVPSNLPPVSRQYMQIDSAVQQSRLDRNKSPVVHDYSIAECLFVYQQMNPNDADLNIVFRIFKDKDYRETYLSVYPKDREFWLTSKIAEKREKDRSM